MTGYGKSLCELPDRKLTIEIKSLNSKQFDYNSRIPNAFKEKELDIRTIVAQRLERGKVDVFVYSEESNAEAKLMFNKELINSYYNELKTIYGALEPNAQTDLFALTLRLPDVIKSNKEEVSDETWAMIEIAVVKALDEIDGYRTTEGKALEKDIILRISLIQELLKQIIPYEQERVERMRSKLKAELDNWKDSDKFDANRYEQELIYYIERFDITEEKIRLANHCVYFLETAAAKEAVGKKLGFITQEIGREINTIGSKANHQEIQKIVVQMKDELEKVKEQLMNVL